MAASDRGSIPACAGETISFLSRRYFVQVYPRLCGGNMGEIHLASGLMGLSPLVRGKLQSPISTMSLMGSIPACAGETSWPLTIGSTARVYPRLCGGNSRTRFEHHLVAGLSPLVRGKLGQHYRYHPNSGSIPACAGETAIRVVIPTMMWVYPRLCGGNIAGRIFRAIGLGLSPLVRGKLLYSTL